MKKHTVPEGRCRSEATQTTVGIGLFSHVCLRQSGPSWPFSEMAAQLEERKILFEMSWVPREQNAEADAITNDDVEWLSPERRVAADMKDLPFLILPEMLAQGESFYAGKDNANAGAPEIPKKDPRSLRVRAPWD